MFAKPLHLIKGIIFDLDGTLLTSALDFQAMRQQINCPPQQDILSFIAALPQEQQHAANQVVLDHELADAQTSSWIEGAQLAISMLQSNRIPTAIVTRNSKEATWLKLNNNQLAVDVVLTREDAPAKPDPSALLQIAELWQLPVQQLAYIGDYLYDLQAANNAQMFAGLYAPEHIPDYSHLADWVFKDFAQLIGLFIANQTPK
jgi:HAD superfamily hydrolase (TIGR01549 family)